MPVHVYVFLLVVCLLLALALLWRHDWLHLQPGSSRGAKRSTFHRLLKPRCPHDGPACRLASTPASDGGLASTPVRPWGEVKSRRGAPKRIPTDGLACPNPQCTYCGISDAQVHALLGDGKHGQAEHIQTFRCQACHTTFSARRNTPLVSSENPLSPGRYGAVCPRGRVGSFGGLAGFRLSTSHHYQPFSRALGSMLRRCTSTLSATSSSRISSWTNCAPGCAVPHKYSGSPSIPARALLPVLQLGSRTQHMAHRLIHALRLTLAPGCLPLFTSDGLNVYFYALTAHFGQWIEVCLRGRNVRKSAGGGGADLRASEEKLPAT
jgi:hypothetical protein